jgi:hypothetical protein
MQDTFTRSLYPDDVDIVISNAPPWGISKSPACDDFRIVPGAALRPGALVLRRRYATRRPDVKFQAAPKPFAVFYAMSL